MGALALLRTAAGNAGAIEAEFEEHKLALFDALAQTPVLWQTQATYCVFAWKDGEARRMPETSGPPRWVALGALAQMPRLHAHAKELVTSVHLKEAVAVAATHVSPR